MDSEKLKERFKNKRIEISEINPVLASIMKDYEGTALSIIINEEEYKKYGYIEKDTLEKFKKTVDFILKASIDEIILKYQEESSKYIKGSNNTTKMMHSIFS